jgi:hypothetical protein
MTRACGARSAEGFETELLGERVDLRAGAHDHAIRDPQTLRGAQEDAVRLLGELEDLGADDPLTQRGREAIHSRADVDRPAELVEKRLLVRRRHDRQRLNRAVPIDEPRRHPGRLERRSPIRDVRTADEHTLPPEQPNPELLLEPLPLSPRPHGHRNQPLIVMTMPKDASAASGLSGPRSSSFEKPNLRTSPRQRVRR